MELGGGGLEVSWDVWPSRFTWRMCGMHHMRGHE